MDVIGCDHVVEKYKKIRTYFKAINLLRRSSPESDVGAQPGLCGKSALKLIFVKGKSNRRAEHSYKKCAGANGIFQWRIFMSRLPVLLVAVSNAWANECCFRRHFRD